MIKNCILQPHIEAIHNKDFSVVKTSKAASGRLFSFAFSGNWVIR